MCQGTRGGHTPPAPHGVDLVCPRMITTGHGAVSKGVVPRRDGWTGLEARSEGVHDQRAPSGVGVDIVNK